MDIINYLDSISILSLAETHGYQVWVIARDMLAWAASIVLFVAFCYIVYAYYKMFKGLKDDLENVKVSGSDANYYMTALVLDSGFHEDLEIFREIHKGEYTNTECHHKVRNRRLFSIVGKISLTGLVCTLLGAEWAIFSLVGIGFVLTYVNSQVAELSFHYEEYMTYEEEE